MSSDQKVFVETVTERIGRHILASNIRPATPKDIEEAAVLHAKGNCPHTCVKDHQGWMYDSRVCFTCGQGLGTV